MAIQMRRGLKKDFDPTKMLPGEWAVTIDNDTEQQIVYMCFSPGTVKRMGTFDDLEAELDPYKQVCVSSANSALASASESKKNADVASASSASAKSSEDKAKQYMEQAFSGTPQGYQQLVGNVASNRQSIADLNVLGWVTPKEFAVQNETDGNQFLQKVFRIDLGSMNWVATGSSGHERIYTTDLVSIIKRPSNDDGVINMYCNKYISASNNANWSHTGGNSIAVTPSGNFYLYDSSILADLSKANKLNGVYAYIELSNPITRTIDGNEAVTRIEDGLADYNLDNKSDGQYFYGYYRNTSGEQVLNQSYQSCQSIFDVKQGDMVSVKITPRANSVILITSWIGNSDTDHVSSANAKEYSYQVESGVTKVTVCIRDMTVKPFNNPFAHIGVYINNPIDTMQSEIDKLKQAIISLGGTV